MTSANAVKIVKALPNKNIFFIPDRNLAHHVAEQVPEKNFVYNEGYCPVHEKMQIAEIKEAKRQHPEALILTHPECPEEIRKISDYVGSTSGIIAYAGKSEIKNLSSARKWVRYRTGKAEPGKKVLFYEDGASLRRYRRQSRWRRSFKVLENGDNEIHVDDELRRNSKKPLERMLELAK